MYLKGSVEAYNNTYELLEIYLTHKSSEESVISPTIPFYISTDEDKSYNYGDPLTFPVTLLFHLN